MPRRDLLTYDVDHRRTSPLSGVSVRLIVVLMVVLMLAVGLVIWTARSHGPAPESANPVPGRPAAASPHPSPTSVGTPRPSASPALVGSDADTSERIPEGSRTAAARFITAWLDSAPKTRKSELQQTATPGLAEQLMLTSTANIPTAKAKGVPVAEDASAYSVQFVQTLTDGMRVRIYLIADPGTRFGWVATSVERV